MIKIVCYMGTWMCMSKIILMNVVKLETDRTGYGMFSRKASLRFITAEGDVYQIRNMKLDACGICMETASREGYLDLTRSMGGWVYIAEKAEV